MIKDKIIPNKNIVEAIEKFLASTCFNGKNYVIGIDGKPGVGKTTICRLLSERNNKIEILSIDDYLLPKKGMLEKILDLEKPSLIYTTGWFDTEKIRTEIIEFKKSRKEGILLVDGVFIHHTKMFGNSFDKTIILNMDEGQREKRNERRIQKIQEKVSGYKEAMHTLFENAWKNYIREYQPEKKASMYIDIAIK